MYRQEISIDAEGWWFASVSEHKIVSSKELADFFTRLTKVKFTVNKLKPSKKNRW